VFEARVQVPNGTRICVVVAVAITATSTKQKIRPRARVKRFGMKFVPSFRLHFFEFQFWNAPFL
jgi:hypothetical protein